MKNSFFLTLMIMILIASLGYANEVKNTDVSNEIKEILAQNLSFDAKTGEIRFSLDQDALIRIRIGLKNSGVIYRHLLDWDLRKAGDYVEVWDKKDETGLVDFSNEQDYILTIACLPIDPDQRKKYKEKILGHRKSPQLSLNFPKNAEKNESGEMILSDIVKIKVEIDDEDYVWLINERYELGIYLDNAFLYEDEEGIDPFTYEFNTKGITNGSHKLMANIFSYSGEVGTASVSINIQN